jgi:hypothetical protein
MKPATFDILARQLRDVDFDIIQTSGNGETFLNPNYIDYIRRLKQDFPNSPRWIYNNFSLLDEEMANIIIRENLFDKVHVTIDSMVPWVYERAKNLNFSTMLSNLSYFLKANAGQIPVTILYNDVRRYYEHCQNVIGMRPARDLFTDKELASVELDDQYDLIKEFFSDYGPVNMCRINPCLWGEREQAPPDPTAPCPKINVIEQVAWVLPDGSITACCYDDRQRDWVVGNIHDEHILDIFNGERRAAAIERIKTRDHTDYPCTNPRCCSFGTGIEAK